MVDDIEKTSGGKEHFSLFESRIRNLKIDDLTMESLIVLSDELQYKQRRVAEEMLSREECDEKDLRYVLRKSSKEPRKEAARRLLKDFPTRDNLGIIIRYCEYYRHQAFELLKKKDPENAQVIFLNNIYKDE